MALERIEYVKGRRSKYDGTWYKTEFYFSTKALRQCPMLRVKQKLVVDIDREHELLVFTVARGRRGTPVRELSSGSGLRLSLPSYTVAPEMMGHYEIVKSTDAQVTFKLVKE